MEGTPHTELTAQELSEQLRELGVGEDTIAQATVRAVTIRREQQEGARWDRAVTDFASAYKRVSAENASDSNIEGWIGQLTDSAWELLASGSEKPELTEGERQVAHAAAVWYVYDQAQSFGFEDPYPPLRELNAKLKGCNIDPAGLRTEFNQAYSGIYNPQGLPEIQAKIDRQFTGFKKMNGLWNGTTPMWRTIITPTLDAAYGAVQAQGFELPVLGEDGLYDEEREDEEL